VHLPSHLLGNFNLPRELISNGLLERTLQLALARALLAADQKDRQPLSAVIACEALGCDINRLAYSKPGRDFTMIQTRFWRLMSLNMARFENPLTGRTTLPHWDAPTC
jgi:hypothetical protein